MKKNWLIALLIFSVILLSLVYIRSGSMSFSSTVNALPQTVLFDDSVWGKIEISDVTMIQNISYLFNHLKLSDKKVSDIESTFAVNGLYIYITGETKHIEISPMYFVIDNTVYEGKNTHNIFNMISDQLFNSTQLANFFGESEEIYLDADDLSSFAPIRLNTLQTRKLAQVFKESTRGNEEMEFLRKNNIDFPNYRIHLKDSNGKIIDIQFYNRNYFQVFDVRGVSNTFKDSGKVWDMISTFIHLPQYGNHEIQYLFYADNVLMYRTKQTFIDITLIKNQIIRGFLSKDEYLGHGNIPPANYPVKLIFKINEEIIEVIINENNISFAGNIFHIKNAAKKFNEIYHLN